MWRKVINNKLYSSFVSKLEVAVGKTAIAESKQYHQWSDII